MDLLIGAEDPGAAGQLIPLWPALRAAGLEAKVFAAGHARDYFSRASIPFTEAGGAVLGSVQPRLVLVGTAENPQSFTHALVDDAKTKGIPSVGAVDSAMNAEKRFRGATQNPLMHLPDYLFLTDEGSRSAFRALGVADEKIFVCGHPNFEATQKKGAELAPRQRELRKKFYPEAGDKPVLVFVSEGAACLRSADYNNDGRTERGIEFFLEGARRVGSPVQLVLRLHPKDKTEYFSTYLPSFQTISSGGDPREWIMGADGVAGLTSMLLTEAALMGKPVLCLVASELEKSWMPSVRSGATPGASSGEEFASMVAELAAQPEKFAPRKGFVAPNPIRTTIEAIQALLGKCR